MSELPLTIDGAIDIECPSVWPTIDQVQAVREWTEKLGQAAEPPQSLTDVLDRERRAERLRANRSIPSVRRANK